MRAVEDGQLKYVSASQINKHLECRRKWYFNKVMGLPEPRLEAFDEGENIHKQMELWYREGKTPEHQSAQHILQNGEIPPRAETTLIEHPQDLNLGLAVADVGLLGRADCLDVSGGILRVFDWKAVKDFRYCKTTEQLDRDVQLNVYAAWAWKNYPDITGVTVHHGYIAKTEINSKVVSSNILTKEHTQDIIEGIASEVEAMKQTAATPDALEVPPTLKACRAYNRLCPFFNRCHAKPEELENTDMEGLDALFNKTAATENTPAPTPRQEDCPILPPDAPKIRTLQERMEMVEAEVKSLRDVVTQLAKNPGSDT